MQPLRRAWIREIHLLNGKAIAQQVREDAKNKIVNIRSTLFPDFRPSLTIVQVGERPDSTTYVNAKLKAARDSGIDCKVIKLPEDTKERQLVAEIERLNDDIKVHGVLVQMPLPKHINEERITNLVAASKDVDGFSAVNMGELAKRSGSPRFVPCTPAGVMKLLKETKMDLRGKKAVVVGRSDIVGTPVSSLLRHADATVTVCHRHTLGLADYIREADIVVAALGRANYIKGDWIKPGAVVIDVGINVIPDESKKSGHRLVGDVDPSAAEKASYLTPVPGGVGPMTVAMLMENVVKAAKYYYENRSKTEVNLITIKPQTPVPSDIEISRSVEPKLITEIASDLDLSQSDFEPYGRYKGKIDLSVLDRLKDRKNGRYILVAGITPTPLGEGKSTTTMGLTQALGNLGKLSIANLRQPSMGPTFGIKGGAAGGGYAQVIPMDEFNLHITGDIHAVTAANNLLAAAIDTRIFHEQTQTDKGLLRRLIPGGKLNSVMQHRWKKLGLPDCAPEELIPEQVRKLVRLDFDHDTITWKRVVDCNDRHLRGITIGEAPTEKGLTRETGFDISVASECMAILALSDSLEDMRERLGRITVGSSKDGEPITAEDIGAAGAMCALMKDAIKPNLMQSLEGTPVLVHAGPFANISIGASSVLADKVALKLAGTDALRPEPGYVITEAGFDFTMGGERFFDIKCRSSGLVPDCVVIVATVRALKLHGGGPEVKPGAPLPKAYTEEDTELVAKGCANLAKQIANASSFGRPVVVAINHFIHDTDAEHQVIRKAAIAAGAADAVVSKHWEKGGAGAIDLAKAVMHVTSTIHDEVKFVYNLNTTAEEKLNAIARKMYGAKGVELSDLAKKKLAEYEAQGFGNLPVCIAKTQYSLSHDPKLRGVPTDFVVPIRDIKVSSGAGYLYALAAEIMTIPGLPTLPGYMNIEVSPDGQIDGMF
ncbi:C-1-tetrahydrofolate synthase, mitochondrial [Wickerhamiella sorbophila]|uniref:C-1-tetrahydrofolate synthase, mitochondrial n=1 Tax=Wickerhamiella sorbophila TaxID=45607 RepID=A0A2T0FER9_9ASCO|nr:C-1-tetrahydrofolate synthase, mitochondrial [Wickerhamiella sorbophila]PRT53474.1 C-1-tetrahydrofolate synthase, mitochondrial [Wickerhamiella sorbophila]